MKSLIEPIKDFFRDEILRTLVFAGVGFLVVIFLENSINVFIGIGVGYLFSWSGEKLINYLLTAAVLVVAVIALAVGGDDLLTGIGIGYLLAWFDHKARE